MPTLGQSFKDSLSSSLRELIQSQLEPLIKSAYRDVLREEGIKISRNRDQSKNLHLLDGLTKVGSLSIRDIEGRVFDKVMVKVKGLKPTANTVLDTAGIKRKILKHIESQLR